MAEIELKFQIPRHTRAAFEEDFLSLQPDSIFLWAKYFDTEDLKLKQHQIALRQRLENDIWFQTLKAPGQQAFERFELEHELGSLAPEQCDLERYSVHKQARKMLKAALGSLHPDLELKFETDVQRYVYTEQFQNSVIEVAYDVGTIRHEDQTVTIDEVEFELKQGELSELIEYTKPWVQRFELWLDSRSKSDRGYQLVMTDQIPNAQHQTLIQFDAHPSSLQLLQKMIANSLEHLLPNAMAITSNQFHDEHVHQARVAIRRLRSALQFFKKQIPSLPHTWSMQLAAVFRQLGSTRDRDAVTLHLLPKLKAADSPVVYLPPSDKEIARIDHVFKTPDTVNLILSLLQFSQTHLPSQDLHPIKALRKQFNQLHNRICKDALDFSELEVAARHTKRKQLKCLRYNVEFLQSLFNETSVQSYLKVLKPLLSTLGDYNDLEVAEQLFQPYTEQDPKAWFVIGWLRAEQHRLVLEAEKQLIHFTHTPPFWQKQKNKH